jgi:hypothetical protein
MSGAAKFLELGGFKSLSEALQEFKVVYTEVNVIESVPVSITDIQI